MHFFFCAFHLDVRQKARWDKTRAAILVRQLSRASEGGRGTKPSTGSAGETRRQAHRRISLTTSLSRQPCRAYPLLSTLVSRGADRRFEIFPDWWTSRRCASCLLTIRRQSYGGTPARGQNRPAMMDSLEDKGAFMTKTKRAQPRSCAGSVARAVSLHP